MKRLIEFIESAGYSADKDLIDKFEIYYKELIDYNSRHNLTAITDREDVIVKHFLDSLTPIKHIPHGARLLDIGSGAGFPGLVLKLVREDITVELLDSVNKKTEFLKYMIELLGLTGVSAAHMRAEEYITGKRESFDAVTARAVAELNALLEYAIPYLRTGGRFIAMKSGDYIEELDRAANAVKILKCKVLETSAFDLPGGISRSLIIFEKTAPTPAAYPRGKNLPRRKPL
jgi:16S rRNA (guanine527-N7)-methyltransferase